MTTNAKITHIYYYNGALHSETLAVMAVRKAEAMLKSMAAAARWERRGETYVDSDGGLWYLEAAE